MATTETATRMAARHRTVAQVIRDWWHSRKTAREKSNWMDMARACLVSAPPAGMMPAEQEHWPAEPFAVLGHNDEGELVWCWEQEPPAEHWESWPEVEPDRCYLN